MPIYLLVEEIFVEAEPEREDAHQGTRKVTHGAIVKR